MSMKESLEEREPDLLFADGHDNAILGMAERNDVYVVVYSVHEIVCNLVEDGRTMEEAVECYHFNIKGAYVGERTPMFLESPE